MIEIQNMTFCYERDAVLSDINLKIREGEKISVIGLSGCGKTTLLHVIAGILRPSNGSVTFKELEVRDICKTAAIILQKDGLFPWKRVEDNVLLGLINTPLSPEQRKLKVSQVLQELDMKSFHDKYLHELSGGQRQRVAIARALVQQPELLLMDEPTGALDMITKEKFQDSLHGLYDRYAMTTVLVTHDIEEAVYLGQRILVMEGGKILHEIHNPYYGEKELRKRIEFYELCLKVRQVMKQ